MSKMKKFPTLVRLFTDKLSMGQITVSAGIPSDALFVSAYLETPKGKVLDAIEGASTGDELTFKNVAPGDYLVVKETLSADGKITVLPAEKVTIAAPKPLKKRCEVKDWFDAPPPPPPPPPPPKLSHRCEVKDWF